ncbi:universal stress protein [Paracoccus lutimaris]|uniref:Nucleotide-binding universal stress UspA family protein n=1 Tax=Paracoccus lutimaris TaxID=1490030 RepID=A0A368Z018_9RHOB|nr:universal stress protein [Paracoccus lutimaris]RCW84826.1 nucleotide-binding universal stress UspA family protein [Paracoccus lutimaris]
MKRYLVGYSADKGGCEALRLGAMLARSAGGSVVAAVILPETWDHPSPAMVDVEYVQFLERHAEKTLAAARAEMPADVPAEFLHRHAESASAGLLALAEEMGVDAIVLGSSRKAPMARFQEGTVATEVLRSARIPVALAPRGYRAPEAKLSRITCAIASSSDSMALAHKAGEIAASFHVPLRLATFIVRDRQMYPSGAGYDVESLVSNKFLTQANAVHDAIRAGWRGADLPDSVFGDGRNWKEAVGALDWKPCELLVIGSSRLGPLMRVFVGSNSGKILRHAPIPRMIVPRITE